MLQPLRPACVRVRGHAILWVGVIYAPRGIHVHRTVRACLLSHSFTTDYLDRVYGFEQCDSPARVLSYGPMAAPAH